MVDSGYGLYPALDALRDPVEFEPIGYYESLFDHGRPRWPSINGDFHSDSFLCIPPAWEPNAVGSRIAQEECVCALVCGLRALCSLRQFFRDLIFRSELCLSLCRAG